MSPNEKEGHIKETGGRKERTGRERGKKVIRKMWRHY
jgi:hypothetical protein